MKIRDRLRANKPPSNDERWNECEIIAIQDQKVEVKHEGKKLNLELTSELISLFKSRVDGEVEGSTAWYIKKSE